MAGYVGRGSSGSLVLPFAVSAKNRVKEFTKEMEMAAVLYLAESNREKGEGILRKPDEKLVFIAETCYPIWLVPWSGGTLLFDGLGVTAHTLSYDTLPDVSAFNKDLQKSAKTSESYSVALSRNANYFKDFAGREEKTIEGLIASPDFMRDFSAYLPKAEEVEKRLTARAVLSPIVDGSEISAFVDDLSDLRARIDGDVKDMDASMSLLSVTTREKVKAIREEIWDVRRKFNRLIKKVKPRVTRKRQRIQKRYGEKIARISRRFQRRLRVLHEDQVRQERMRRRLGAEANRCEARIKSCRRRKKRRSEFQWALKLKRIKKRLPVIEKNIRDNIKRIENLETAEKLEVSQNRAECDTRIEGAMEVLRELEVSRHARIKMKRQEITSLEDATSLIINRINEIAKSKKTALNEFDRIGLPRRRKAVTLVYLPFYLARYETEANKRYVVYPPSIVGDMGILTKMKGALGAARMKAFLRPRSKAITLFLNQLVTLIQRNPMLEKELTDAGIHGSVLRMKQLRMGVKRGLKRLKDEEWISESEFQTCGKLLYIYA